MSISKILLLSPMLCGTSTAPENACLGLADDPNSDFDWRGVQTMIVKLLSLTIQQAYKLKDFHRFINYVSQQETIHRLRIMNYEVTR
jgi:hypothetical protein